MMGAVMTLARYHAREVIKKELKDKGIKLASVCAGLRAGRQGSLVRGAQDDTGRLVCFECILPAGRTQTPAIAGFQARKTNFRHRSRKIVAARF